MNTAIPEANSVSSYLEMDFPELRSDAVKERQLLRKLGPAEERPGAQSVLATSMQFGMAIEFERSDHVRRMRLFLSEILRVMSKVRCVHQCSANEGSRGGIAHWFHVVHLYLHH